MKVTSPIEELLAFQLKACGVPLPAREFRFHHSRKWRLDFCWVEERLAVELEGGLFVRGRHVRPSGYENDLEKYNECVALGFRLLRFSRSQVEDGSALALILRCLENRPAGVG